MTEKEAIEWLAEETSPTLIHIAEMKKENPMEYINEAIKVACHALGEIQQYRAIGTIEEFKDLKEKSVAKKVKKQENNILIAEGWEYGCPSCGCGIGTNRKYSGFAQEDEYCPTCGQKLDWE